MPSEQKRTHSKMERLWCEDCSKRRACIVYNFRRLCMTCYRRACRPQQELPCGWIGGIP